jgi:CHAT domain-containing protein
VLSGCETAGGETGAAATLGLAQAFLSAGSAAVVASSRKIRDQLARDLTISFFRELSVRATLEPTYALRAAQIEVHQRQPEADWAALRVLVP